MLSYAADNFAEDIPSLELDLAIPCSRAKIWRIDKTHANAMHAWRAFGSPEHPTDSERSKIAAMASVSAEKIEFNKEISLKMTPNSVILIETEE